MQLLRPSIIGHLLLVCWVPFPFDKSHKQDTQQVLQAEREGTLEAFLPQRHTEHHCMLGIAQHWGHSQEQNRHSFCSQETISVMGRQKKYVYIYMFNEGLNKNAGAVKSWSGNEGWHRSKGFPWETDVQQSWNVEGINQGERAACKGCTCIRDPKTTTFAQKWEEVQDDQGPGRLWEEHESWGLREGLKTTFPLSRIWMVI